MTARPRFGGLLLTALLGGSACGDGSTGQPQESESATSEDSTGGTSGDTTTTADTGGSTGSGDATTSGVSSSDSTSGDPTVSTGTSGNEGTGSTGATELGDQWATVELSYTGPGVDASVSLDDCTFCDATIDSGVVLIRYQQAEGWTVWSIYLPTTQGTGTHPLTPDLSGAYVVISENNPDLPAAAHGFYAGNTNAGTVELTQADMTPGGTVAGTISATLSNAGITATIDAEFSAVLMGL
jgi:hypothetical protein